jgi:DsbC/DsbD-like thiol-disulfide interchange protein
MKPMPVAILLFLAAASAQGGETPWQEVMPDVAMRLVSTDAMTEGGTTWIAVEIDMPDTTKTYWRVPGESGIPPRFDFAGSAGIGAHRVAWPYPTRDEAQGYLDHVYLGRTILPVEIEVTGDDPMIDLNVTLGICSDVCVPVSADFALPLDLDQPDRPNTVRMQQARAEVPVAWSGDDLLGDIRFVPGEGALVTDLIGDGFPAGSAIADIAGRPLLFGPPEIASDGRTLRFPLLGKAQSAPVEGEAVHITFMGEDGPYELVRPLRVSAP